MDKFELLAALQRELEAEARPSPTVRVLAERWAEVHRGHLEDFKTEEGRLRLHVLPFFGDREALALTIFDIDGEKGYRASRLVKLRGGGKLRPATRNREVDLLNRVLNWAVEEGLLTRNPVAHAKPEQEHNVQHSKIESETKLRALRDEADRPLMDALMVCLYETGARRKEVHTLRWDQFEGGRWVVFPRTKNHEPRRVKLTPRAHAALMSLPRFDDCPWVFANPATKRRYNSRHLDRLFARIVENSGLKGVNGENITPHKFRHGMAYRLRRVFKRQTAAAMKMLGQKTDAAYRRYGISDEEETEEGWDVVARGEEILRDPLDRRPPRRAQRTLPVDEQLQRNGSRV